MQPKILSFSRWSCVSLTPIWLLGTGLDNPEGESLEDA